MVIAGVSILPAGERRQLPEPEAAQPAQSGAAGDVTAPSVTETSSDPTPSASPSMKAPSETPPDETAAASPKETQEPEADPEAVRAKAILAEMTTWEKVCQLFVVPPESITGLAPTTVAGTITKAGLEKYPVGGIVYFSQNLLTGEQTETMIAHIQSYSKLGLLISADEEGGAVSRLMRKLGTTYIKSMYYYKDDGPETAYGNASTIAQDMASFGFNTDFAPVADVWSNKLNTIIGARAYSDDFEQAAALVAAAVRGFTDHGVICTLKHFPGHGDTAEDSHVESAYVDKTQDELMAQELLPFVSGIEAGADMVMVGHLTVPAMDKAPATISYTIVTGLLRNTLGFDGVVITDGLGMNAVAGYCSPAQIAVKAIGAGVDILLGPVSLPEATSGIIEALETGELTIEQIDESVLRILILKLKHGIIR
jgi:beta-N-acetylhexosaminidase